MDSVILPVKNISATNWLPPSETDAAWRRFYVSEWAQRGIMGEIRGCYGNRYNSQAMHENLQLVDFRTGTGITLEPAENIKHAQEVVDRAAVERLTAQIEGDWANGREMQGED